MIAGEGSEAVRPSPMPASLQAIGEARRVPFDVRPDLARGEEPFARIMATVKTLDADQALLLRAPFEPIPLYDVLARRGLAHWTEQLGPKDWRVWFWRDTPGEQGAAEPPETAWAGRSPGSGLPSGGHADTLDVRGLEPPQPMVRVLARLDTLGAGETLHVLHDRRPLFLYPQLEARGFTHETDEPAPGLVRIRIRSATT